MTALQICELAARNLGRTFDPAKTFIEMDLDMAAFHAEVQGINGSEPQPPTEPIEPECFGQDYVNLFTTGGGA